MERVGKRDEQHDPHMRNRKGSRGITLVELLFGLAIVATLTGLALPSMRSALRAAAVRTATLDLVAGLQQTRASSIAAARPGVLCLSDMSGICLGNGGTSGAWRAFLESDGRQLPLAASALPAGVLLKSSRSRLAFWPDSLSASTATLTICDSLGIARPRVIVMSQGGRLRLAESGEATCGA